MSVITSSYFIAITLITLNILGMFLLVNLKIFRVFNITFIRFLATGSLNTFVYFLFHTTLLNFVDYKIAHILAFLLSAFISYFVTTYYTFNNKPSFKTFIKFPLSFLPNFILSTFGTILLVSYFGTSEKYTSVVMLVLAIPITFMINRFIFRNKE